MNIYCISGLGADQRVFKYLTIKYPLIHVEWISPMQNETLSSYSRRLAEQINTEAPFVLLGLSFGGLVACEMASFLNPKKVILLSSITNKKYLPLLFQIIGLMGLHKIIPASWMNPPMRIANWFFGVKKKENQQLLKVIFADTDRVFLKWAIGQLFNKEKITIPNHLFRIHGTNDRLLPLREGEDVIQIKDGGHFMVIEQAEEVSKALNDIL